MILTIILKIKTKLSHFLDTHNRQINIGIDVISKITDVNQNT